MELTFNQRAAAYTTERLSYVESVPGSGKTAIAVERFGYLRYSVRSSRGVLALTYNRAACAELVQRIYFRWGPRCVANVHRVMTFDEVYRDILDFLLSRSLIVWPGLDGVLEVRDSYRGFSGFRTFRKGEKALVYSARLDSSRCVESVYGEVKGVTSGISKKRDHHEVLKRGIVTHDDVRTIVASALDDSELAAQIQGWLLGQFRAFVVDEVFDLNLLDVRFVYLAVESNLVVSLIGDPWQTLYGWRGARPELVQSMIVQGGSSPVIPGRFVCYAQDDSFRFSEPDQIRLVSDLRQGKGVALPAVTSLDVDVVLSRYWCDLLDCGTNVLPLALKTIHNQVDAALNLFLNSLTRRYFDCNSFGRDLALSVLRLSVEEFEPLQDLVFIDLVERLYHGASPSEIFDELLILIGSLVKGRKPSVHKNKRNEYVGVVASLAMRLHSESLIPGLTVFQAKGREWDRVAVVLFEDDVDRLAKGIYPFVKDELDEDACLLDEDACILYVAITRGRRLTGQILLQSSCVDVQGN